MPELDSWHVSGARVSVGKVERLVLGGAAAVTLARPQVVEPLVEGREQRRRSGGGEVVELVGILGEVVELLLAGRVLDVGVPVHAQSLEFGDVGPRGLAGADRGRGRRRAVTGARLVQVVGFELRGSRSVVR